MTPNRDRQRSAARARLERDMTVRAEAARQRRRRNQAILGVTLAVAVVAAGVVVAVLAFGGDDDKKPSANASSGPAACKWTPRIDPSAPANQPKPAVKDVGTPPAGEPRAGKQTMQLDTNVGMIKVEMDAAKTPCTSASFTHLAGKKFFDGTSCHRIAPSIGALQCGDPAGDGTGGPSYEFADENLPVNQRPAYPKGTVAMANGGPGTNGSQFFFLFADAELDPNYTVFGHVVEGMDVLEKIAAGGSDGAFDPSPGGGHPKTKVTFNSVTVTPAAS